MTTEDIRREDRDGIITVTFDRPRKRNAINTPMWEVLGQAVRDLGDDDSIRVLVITGEGEWFTSGLDYANLRPNVGEGTDGIVRGSNIRRQYRAEAYHDLFDEMESIEKPVVLAVQGHCFGVGMEMGSSCDFRLAAAGAKFALPEVPNIAVLPGSGGISRLTRIVGPHWAKWLVMAGQTIDADAAERIGWIHAVYPPEGFVNQVRQFAQRLAAMPREALGLAKVAIGTADTVDRRTAREVDRLAQTLLFMSDDFKDKVRAFSESPRSRSEPPA